MRAPPAYQLLQQRLRDEIAAGAYRDGARLPTESELVARLGLSRQTVRRAFQELVSEGSVYRVPGRGTFVNERFLRQLGSIEDLMNLSEDTTMEVRTGLSRRVDVEAASRLRLTDDVVYAMTLRRLHDGVPFVLTRIFLPENVARTVLNAAETVAGAVSTATVIGLIEPGLVHPIAEAAQSITVGAADAEVADAVGCAPGHPMLRVDRLYSDTSGTPVELAVSHFLPEHYTYRVTLRRSS